MSGDAGRGAEIRVWDPFVRLSHWATVALFAAAFLGSDQKWLHEPAGYALLVLTSLRILWGFAGPRHARFVSFVVSPAAVLRYLRLLRQGRAPRYLGHNPAGGAMIVLLLADLSLAAVSGWMAETDRWFGVPWVDALHHITGNLLLPLAVLHVAGVIVSSWLHRENLVRAMITGGKPRQAPEYADLRADAGGREASERRL